MMIEIYTIASKPQYIMDLCQIHESFKYDAIFQARPGMHLPILIKDKVESRLVMATWGIESMTREKNQVNVISTDKILRTPPFNVLMQTQRCAILANCFFTEHKKEAYLIRLIRPRLFCIGGIYVQEGNEYRFAMLKTASADVLAGLMDDMPLVFTHERLHVWLQSEHTFTIMNFAAKAGGHWFDFFKVSTDILASTSNDKDLLVPLGMSLQQMKARDDKLSEIDFQEERANRKSMKH
jgi:putative SOS response-associated peptidase YedK